MGERMYDRFGNLICNKWIKCSDANYWSDIPGYITIIKLKMETCETETYLQNNCPYGWNVIIKNNGWLMNIKL